jgi:hypothetical protein
VTALILERPMCVKCIASKTGMSLPEIDAVLGRIGSALALYRGSAACRTCEQVTDVVSVVRQSRRRPVLRDAILEFLRSHRGETFCARCLAAAVNTRRADIQIRELEGWGARRRDGTCARCGERRLVSGLKA